jgi:hypothetical protein
LLVSTHAPPHFTEGGKQSAAQLPLRQTRRVPQELPQFPQFFGSVWVLTQAPLQTFPFPGQLSLQFPPEHATDPPSGFLQVFPQVPQLLRSEARTTHTAPHWSYPGLQAKEQEEPPQEGLALGGASQTLPQSLQFFGSVLVSTQAPLQTVLLPQSWEHFPSEQNMPSGQAWPQPPQLALSLLVLTQDSPQTVRPPLQLTVHLPPEQLAKAPPEAVQVFPHSPQFCGSPWVSTQDSPQRV